MAVKIIRQKENRILIYPGGGIGDTIVSLPSFDLIAHFFADDKTDIIVSNCKNVERTQQIFGPQRCSLVTAWYAGHADLPDYHSFDTSQGVFALDEFNRMIVTQQLLRKYPKFYPLFKENAQRNEFFQPFLKQDLLPYSHYQLAANAVKLGLDRYSLPIWSLGLSQKDIPAFLTKSHNKTSANWLSMLANVHLDGLPVHYVTINDGWNITGKDERPTKAWPATYWHELIDLLKQRGLKVVQIGAIDNGETYSNVDVQLKGKLSFLDSLKVLQGSMCHVDIEGGLVHAAHKLNTRCVVLFGPTPVDFFGYQDNVNLIHGSCQNCYWINKSWTVECTSSLRADINFIKNSCMMHKPDLVAHHVVMTVAKGKK